MPADPTPAPEWAVKMLVGAYNAPPGTWRLFTHDPLARLLASVRDAALREAAEVCATNAAYLDARPDCDGGGDCRMDESDILALVGTAPKEAPRG